MSPSKTNEINNNRIKPWINNALSNSFLYGDGKPHWSNSVSQSDAVKERNKLCRFLFKHAFVKPELRNIAERIEYCSPNDRCKRGVCPECGRALQRFFVSECQPLLAEKAICIASIIDSQMSNREDLSHFSASGLINRVKTILRKNGVHLAAGGIDFSFNQDGRGAFRSHWCAHLWLILPSCNRDRWEPVLRKANPASDTTPRPVKIAEWDGHNEALAYALKTTFKRRVSVNKKKRSVGRSGRNTSEQDLRVSERIPLYQYLDSVGLHSRVFLLGARPTMTDRGISIVKLDSENQ
jgi:hypothetical protein